MQHGIDRDLKSRMARHALLMSHLAVLDPEAVLEFAMCHFDLPAVHIGQVFRLICLLSSGFWTLVCLRPCQLGLRQVFQVRYRSLRVLESEAKPR